MRATEQTTIYRSEDFSGEQTAENISKSRREIEKVYRPEIDKLIERAKQKDPKSDGLPLGEKFFVELLRFYIFQYRTNRITAEELRQKKKLLERDLINYWDSKKMFKNACEVRNRQSQVLIEAEKHGCEICRRLVRIFDGRDLE